MEKQGIKIDILPNYFLNVDGTFNREEAKKLSGKVAGVCYDPEGFKHIDHEDIKKTEKRIDDTLNNGHHSVYDHIMINFELQNIPKILAMVLNNEKQYTTSEKSGRYTKVVRNDDSIITIKEEELYNKWLEIFKIRIKDLYGNVYNNFKIRTLAQENARYLITVFMPTQMIYSTTFRQINYIASWMKEYIENIDVTNDFQVKLANSMTDLLNELERVNVLEEALMRNEKHRKLSLFGKNLSEKETYFGDVYSYTYSGSFAQFAQLQRHRTIDYQIELMDEKEFFIPPIIKDDPNLVTEWLNDLNSLKDIYPQGEMVRINELGKYEDFILKCKERLCTHAQLEIMLQTRETLLKYKEELEKRNSSLAQDIKNYCNGARCTFKDFECTADCKNKEGKTLTRRI